MEKQSISKQGSTLKILVFSRNSPWGVIRKSDGSLLYKHVMKFENETLKDEFILNHLLTETQKQNVLASTGNWTTLFRDFNYSAYQQLNDKNISFKINVDEFEGTYDSLLNADFCAIELAGVIKFYALKLSNATPRIIEFDGELDIFFTYNISFREDSSNYLVRGHVNRVSKQDDYKNSDSDVDIPSTSTLGAYRWKPFRFIPHYYNNDEPQFDGLPKNFHRKLEESTSTLDPYDNSHNDLGWMLVYQTFRGDINNPPSTRASKKILKVVSKSIPTPEKLEDQEALEHLQGKKNLSDEELNNFFSNTKPIETRQSCPSFDTAKTYCPKGFTFIPRHPVNWCQCNGNPYPRTSKGDDACKWHKWENDYNNADPRYNCYPDHPAPKPDSSEEDTDTVQTGNTDTGAVVEESYRFKRLSNTPITGVSILPNEPQINLPYNIYMIPVLLNKKPFVNGQERTIEKVIFQRDGTTYDIFSELWEECYDKITTYKAVILKNPPFPIKKGSQNNFIDIKYNDRDNPTQIIVDIPTQEDANLNVDFIQIEDKSKYILGYRRIDYNQNRTHSTISYDSPLDSYFSNTFVASWEDDFSRFEKTFSDLKDLDPKILSHQFSSLYVKDYFGNFNEYYFNYLDLWNIFLLQGDIPAKIARYEGVNGSIYYNSLSPENISEIVRFHNWNENNDLIGNYLLNNINTSLPLASNNYQEYLKTNEASIANQQQIAGDKLGLETQKIAIAQGKNIFETGTAVAIGGAAAIGYGLNLNFGKSALAAGGAIAAGVRGGIIGKELGVRELEAGKVRDWVNQTISSGLIDKSKLPNSNRIYSSNFWELFQNDLSREVNISFASIEKEKQQILNKFFNEYGYLINETVNLNQYLDSRIYFNYVQAQDTFNTLDLKLSSPMKQIINNAFAGGLFIWHYRGEDTWKGVLNYRYINWETSIFDYPDPIEDEVRNKNPIEDKVKNRSDDWNWENNE